MVVFGIEAELCAVTAGGRSSGGKRSKAMGDVKVRRLRSRGSRQASGDRAMRPLCGSSTPNPMGIVRELLPQASCKVERTWTESDLGNRPGCPGQDRCIEKPNFRRNVPCHHPNRKPGL